MIRRPTPLRAVRADRGAALLVAIILVAALALISLAVVNRSSNEIQSVAAKRRYDSAASCADAAQALIRSQLQTYGATSVQTSLSPVTINDATMMTGHYDATGPATITSITVGSPQATSAGGGDMTNRIGRPATTKTYRAVVVCKNTNYPGHQIEAEVLFSFGL